MSSLSLSPTDLLDQVSDSFYRRGVDYQRSGRVLSSATRRDGGNTIVTGRVQGSGAQVYTVYVQLESDARGVVTMDGDCSCPVGYNCKHVVAVLLQEAGADEADEVRAAGEAGDGPHDDYFLDTWASQLSEAGCAPAGDAHPAEVAERLLYLLRLREYPAAAPRPVVELLTCRTLKRGGYGKATWFNAERALGPYPPRWLLPADIEILRLLGGGRELALSGALGARVLQAMVRSGRCHWGDKDTPALALGDARPATCRWQLADDGRQWLVFDADPAITVTLAVSPPWYVDVERRQCGPLETELSPTVAAAAAQAPPVTPAQAQRLPPALQRTLVVLRLPPPRVLDIEELGDAPIACLRLLPAGSLPQPPGTREWYRAPAPAPPRARLSFDYAGVEIPFDLAAENTPALTRRGERLLRVRRDALAEEQFVEALRACALVPMVDVSPMAAVGEGEPFALVADLGMTDMSEAEVWRHFLHREMPRLRAAGWRIEVDDEFDHRVAVAEGWYGEATSSGANDEGGENGWFDFDLGVIVDGQRQPLLPILHQWFNRGGSLETLEGLSDNEEVAIQQPDGRSLFLPVARLRAIVKTLIELCDPELRLAGDALRLSVWRAAEVERLASGDDPAAPWHWRGGERLRALAEKLEGYTGIEPLAPPPGFGAELRPYQRDGLGWLQFLRGFGLGGILADDMGLGKTVQTLAHLLTELRAGRLDRPSLVISPTSLVANWALEAQRFAPQLQVLTLHGPERKARFADIAEQHLVLTTYTLALRDREALAAQPYHLLILDEAQAIKNPRAKVTRAIAALEARSRLCLTGTPLENHLGELWSLVQFLEPGLLGDQRQFRRLFRTPIEKHGDADRQAILQRRLAPIMLRRAKSEVLGELPDKTEIERVVELEPGQRDLYETIRLAMHDKIRGAVARQGLARSQILILDALLKLRQVCCHPRLVKLDAARKVRASAKLALLMDLLPEMVEEGRRVLLFSQFTAMLALIEEALAARGLDYVKLTGRTRDRMTPIARFQTGEIPVFLISLKAGGTGLNLTAADTVIHYDPWWNPAVQDQATDRAHRIGQSKKVFVYKLVTAGTVEQKILAMQARKRRLAASVFAAPGGPGAARFSAEDLENLFAPLD